jgi:hypothetical protein
MVSNIIYVQIYKNRFIVTNFDRNAVVETSNTELFSTQRLLVGKFSVAESLLSEVVKKVSGTISLFVKPAIVIHPLEMVEGGLSEVEERLFRELALGAGASRVLLWVGHVLSKNEVYAKIKST